MKEYQDFEIRFSPGASGSYHVYATTKDGGQGEGIFTLPTNDPAFQTLLERLKNLDIDEDALTQIGQRLFAALFGGDVKRVYDKAQASLEPTEGFRLRLNIDPKEIALASLPWEFLYDPDQPAPLAMLDTPIVRYIPQLTGAPVLQTSLPLRVLLTGAQTPPPAEVVRELEQIEDTLVQLRTKGLVEVVVEPRLTTDIFQQRLLEGFHVWHFVGHGRYEGRNGQLVFESESTPGDPKGVGTVELAAMLYRTSVRLVVLDACESGRLATDAFRSVAPALIRAQVPAVVAMQFSAPEELTIAFARRFYQSLTEGRPIDACVTDGRKRVLNVSGPDLPDWGIPVVYTRAENGKLFDLPKESTSTPAASHPAASGGAGVNQNANIQISGNSTLNHSPINVSIRNEGRPASPALEDDGDYEEEVAGLETQIANQQRILRQLSTSLALQGFVADPRQSIERDQLEQDIVGSYGKLIAIQQRRLGMLERRAARDNSAIYDEPIRSLTYNLLDNTIKMKRMGLRQRERLRNSTGGTYRASVDTEIKQIEREIAELEHQQQELEG